MHNQCIFVPKDYYELEQNTDAAAYEDKQPIQNYYDNHYSAKWDCDHEKAVFAVYHDSNYWTKLTKAASQAQHLANPDNENLKQEANLWKDFTVKDESPNCGMLNPLLPPLVEIRWEECFEDDGKYYRFEGARSIQMAMAAVSLGLLGLILI